MRTTALVALLPLLGAGLGCATRRIPYPLERVPAGRAPVHPLRVAIPPLIDARAPEDREDEAEAFVYRGVEYDFTDLSQLAGGVGGQLAVLLGQHLARRRVFAQIQLVRSAEDAEGADLVLTGAVRRARGYVEAEAPEPPTPPRVRPGAPPKLAAPPVATSTAGQRRVLGEVFLSNLVLTERSGARRALLDVDVGWAIDEARPVGEDGPPSPWAVLGEVLLPAAEQLAEVVSGADLSGAEPLRRRVELPGWREVSSTTTAASSATVAPGLDALRPPPGWRLEEPSPGVPEGWSGPACPARRLVARQSHRYHRVLGPYRPSVLVWRCPPEARLRLDMRAELPAVALGRDARGASLLVHAVGETNWPGAAEELAAWFGLARPDGHVYELAPGGDRSVRRRSPRP